tara:strand:+ start:317 stop:523 length:207 start_codon:yes stop_codon:yes gene_type:complete
MTLALLLISVLLLGLTMWLRWGRSTQIQGNRIHPNSVQLSDYPVENGRKPDTLTLPPDAGSGMELRGA